MFYVGPVCLFCQFNVNAHPSVHCASEVTGAGDAPNSWPEVEQEETSTQSQDCHRWTYRDPGAPRGTSQRVAPLSQCVRMSEGCSDEAGDGVNWAEEQHLDLFPIFQYVNVL